MKQCLHIERTRSRTWCGRLVRAVAVFFGKPEAAIFEPRCCEVCRNTWVRHTYLRGVLS